MKSLLDRIWTIAAYVIVSNRIWLGIDGFYDRNDKDQECIGQIRIFLPFIYIGRCWGYTPSGLPLTSPCYV